MMKRLQTTGLLVLSFGFVIFLQACNPPAPSGNSTEPPTNNPLTESVSSEYLDMGDYKFKLEPEIGKGGETHLDFYVHDQKDNHVSGAQVVVHLTAADGHKSTVNLEEDKVDKHYHGKTMLDDLGDYQAVAQVTVNGEKLNPRFSFTRNQ